MPWSASGSTCCRPPPSCHRHRTRRQASGWRRGGGSIAPSSPPGCSTCSRNATPTGSTTRAACSKRGVARWRRSAGASSSWGPMAASSARRSTSSRTARSSCGSTAAGSSASSAARCQSGLDWSRRTPLAHRAQTVVGRADLHRHHQRPVVQTRPDALVDLLGQPVRGDDGREPEVVAVVEQLEELLLGPGRWALLAEVVEDQHSGPLHPVEELVVAHFARGSERRLQVVEEVRYDLEHQVRSALHELVRDRGGQVGLTRAEAALQDEPATGVADELARGAVRVLNAGDRRVERLEGQVLERVELRPELDEAPLLDLASQAVAHELAAEVRVADRNVPPDPTGALTRRTRRFSRRRRSTPVWPWRRDPAQRCSEPLHPDPVLQWPSARGYA